MRLRARRTHVFEAVFAAGLLVTIAADPASAMAGDLDSSFNGSGKVTTDFSGSEGDLAYAVAIQPDGRTVVAGRTLRTGPEGDYDFALARYTRSGALDRTFDTDGRVTTGFGRGGVTFNDQIYGLAIQPDGKIVAAGWAGPYLAVARYTTAGKLDATFSGDGRQLITFGFAGTGLNVANDVAIQPDGKIVVAGEGWNGTDFDFVLARFNSNGKLDATFGAGGKVLTDFGHTEYGRGLDIAAIDGQIVVSGAVGTTSDFDIGVARYDTNGALDQGFSGNGKKTVVYAGMNGTANDVAIAPSGRIVLAGTVAGGGLSDFALVRLKPSGQLVGKGQTDFVGGFDTGAAVVIQTNGRIVVAGLADGENFGLARYTPNGVLDPTFGAGGKVITDFGSDGAQAKALALQPDGKIVAAGEWFSFTVGGDFAVARYLAA
jgi:uncharacterized delta-60 repeat protein